MVTKARTWAVVMYPESMIKNWQREIGTLIPFPIAYCIHNKDKDEKGEKRKEHVHFLIQYSNTTTEKNIIEIFSQIGTVNIAKKVLNIRNYYDYLIHDTKDCEEKGKYKYKEKERILINNFDIGLYEQIDQEKEIKIEKEILDDIENHCFIDFATFVDYVKIHYDNTKYQVFKKNQYLFNNYIKGNFNRIKRQEP